MYVGKYALVNYKLAKTLRFLCFLLARFGKVEDAVVMYDKKTGRSRGFGFITYDNPDVVRKVSGFLVVLLLGCSCRYRLPP